VAQNTVKRCLLSIMAINLVLSEKSRKYPDRLSNNQLFKSLYHAACKPLQFRFIIERHGPGTPASYSGGPRFRSWRPAILHRGRFLPNHHHRSSYQSTLCNLATLPLHLVDHVKKTHGREEEQLRAFLTAILDGSGQLHVLATLPLRTIDRKEKSSALPEIQNRFVSLPVP
jgi:hypothetical protein